MLILDIACVQPGDTVIQNSLTMCHNATKEERNPLTLVKTWEPLTATFGFVQF